MVHVEDYETIVDKYCTIPVTFAEHLVQTLDPTTLPGDWNSDVVKPETQLIGDEWVRSRNNLVLCVPSAVTLGEVNYLVNPDHPDFDQLAIEAPMNFSLDPRL